jgi:hypothetical protein
MGAISHSMIDVDGDAGAAHAPTILLIHEFPSSSSTGHFASATAAGKITQFVTNFLSDTTQRQRHGAAEPRI